MRSLFVLAILPLVSGENHTETGASQGVATRIPLARTFRHRPIIISPHASKVFDERITRAEFLGLKSKYRDAERFIRGAGLNPPIILPAVYDSSQHANVDRSIEGSLDNRYVDIVDSKNVTFHPFWIHDLQPHVDYHTSFSNTNSSYPRGKRRCAGEDGILCDIQPRSENASSSGDQPRPTSLEPNFAPPDLDNPLLPPLLLPGNSGQSNGKRQAARMELMDHVVGGLDVLYYGSLNFGWPPQELTLDIDTGSADLWVPTSKCSSCKSKTFEIAKSISFNDTEKPFQVVYGSGWAKGTIAQDRVLLGNITCDNQYFGAATDVSDDFRGSPASGVLGLAFGTISSTKESPYFEHLILSTKLAAPMFAVHLTRGKEKGSELCLGCIDSSKFSGEIYWIDVKSKTYWSVAMTGHSVGGDTYIFDAPITAAMDTGSTLIYLPINTAEAFYRNIPGSRSAPEYGDAIWTYPCSSQLDLSLRFEERLYQIHPWDFNLGRTDPNSNECVGSVLGLPDDFPSDFAIIGDEFLKNWYSVYDYRHNGRVGLAYSVNNK
ncbi:aspartyl protease [Ceratobasidium sp. AG-Ba]|nr:aspartyl protease [Ceratobasidium sp. AG-Ba]